MAYLGFYHTSSTELIMKIVHNQCQKQPSVGVRRKRCSENMQQIYRRTPMPKCDFNKFNKAPLLKSLFGMRVLLNICCIFLEHLFPRTLLKGCFSNAVSSLYKKLYHICLARSQIQLQIGVNSPC